MGDPPEIGQSSVSNPHYPCSGGRFRAPASPGRGRLIQGFPPYCKIEAYCKRRDSTPTARSRLRRSTHLLECPHWTSLSPRRVAAGSSTPCGGGLAPVSG